MTNPEVDKLVLAVAEPQWLKVLMIADGVRKRLGYDSDTDYYDVILDRIQALVEDGRLIAKGDPEIPRHCEVRLP